MTAEFSVTIKCVSKAAGRRCLQMTTPRPGTAKAARGHAEKAGWEVQRGNHGRDVCPPCRIVEIERSAGLAVGEAEPEPVGR